MRYKTILYLTGLCVAFTSCVAEFGSEIPQKIRQVVIDGRITTAPGPYIVRLSHSHEFDQPLNFVDRNAVSGAEIEIFDNTGTSEMLNELRPGVYATALDGSGMRGEIGKSYHIQLPHKKVGSISQYHKRFFPHLKLSH